MNGLDAQGIMPPAPSGRLLGSTISMTTHPASSHAENRSASAKERDAIKPEIDALQRREEIQIERLLGGRDHGLPDNYPEVYVRHNYPIVRTPLLALTGTGANGLLAGPFSTAPVAPSNSLPWAGQCSVVPSPALTAAPRWVHAAE